MREKLVRHDPKAAQVVQNVLTHIAEHEHNFVQKQKTRPALMMLLKQMPTPPPGAPPPAHPPIPAKRPGVPVKPVMPAGRAPGGPVAARPVPGRPMPRKQLPMSGGMKPTVPVASPAQAPIAAGTK